MESGAKQAALFLVSVFCLCVVAAAAEQQAAEVHTKLGSLRGRYVSVRGKEAGVHAYLGVPFAKPPLGPALRLAAPQPVEAWEGVRDATKQPLMCIQNRTFAVELVKILGEFVEDIPDVSEDCLYLNIYTPANRAPGAKLPVMVWIHGGGFGLGSASMYDGSALAVYQDVVVVLLQYRLGVMGFLSTGDEHMPGNYGMLDQVQALKWIQEHVQNFGGDPDLVTIFGESAGGVSVSLLLLSPLSDGLFHRAIAESGTAAMDVLITKDPLPLMQIAANASGCSLESTEKMANCMRNLDLDSILPLLEDVTMRFTLTIDRHFLTKSVDDYFARRELHTVPFMTGVNNDEGGWMLAQYFAPANWTEGIDQEHFINVMSRVYDTKDVILRDLMVEEYTGSGEDRVKNRNGLTEMLADVMFNIPVIKTANVHRDAGVPVYLYEYQHPPTILQELRPSFVRSDHGDEIFMVFGICLTTTYSQLADKCSEDEVQFSKTVMSYWGNFARTGSPNGNGLAHWPKYGAEEKYLAIGLKEQVVARHLNKERFVFLTEKIPEKMRQHRETTEHGEL